MTITDERLVRERRVGAWLDRWSDTMPSELEFWSLYCAGVRTVVTHGGPDAPFVECLDELSIVDGVFGSSRKLILRRPAEFIALQMKVEP